MLTSLTKLFSYAGEKLRSLSGRKESKELALLEPDALRMRVALFQELLESEPKPLRQAADEYGRKVRELTLKSQNYMLAAGSQEHVAQPVCAECGLHVLLCRCAIEVRDPNRFDGIVPQVLVSKPKPAPEPEPVVERSAARYSPTIEIQLAIPVPEAVAEVEENSHESAWPQPADLPVIEVAASPTISCRPIPSPCGEAELHWLPAVRQAEFVAEEEQFSTSFTFHYPPDPEWSLAEFDAALTAVPVPSGYVAVPVEEVAPVAAHLLYAAFAAMPVAFEALDELMFEPASLPLLAFTAVDEDDWISEAANRPGPRLVLVEPVALPPAKTAPIKPAAKTATTSSPETQPSTTNPRSGRRRSKRG